MSRLNTQNRLNEGPRQLDVPRSFLVNPQRISAGRTQDLGGLLRQLGGTALSVSASIRTRQEQDNQDEFVETLNSLNEKKSAFDRNEIASAELLQDYDAARDRFQDPQQQARLISFGEPFKTDLVEQTQQRQTSAAAGFLDTKVRELAFSLTSDEEFLEDVTRLPQPEQLEAIRGELYDSIPPELLETIDQDERLQAALTGHVLSVARTTSGIRSQQLAAEERKVQQYAVSSGLTSILEGADIPTTVNTLTARQGIPEEDVWSGLTDAVTGNMTAASQAGNPTELVRQMRLAQGLLDSAPALYGKERGELGKAIAIAAGEIGDTTATTLTNAAEVARLSGVSPEEIQGVILDNALLSAGTILGEEFETRESLLAYIPENSAEKRVHEQLLDVISSVEVEQATRTKTVQDAVTALQSPTNAAPGNILAPLSMGQADLNQFLDGVTETLLANNEDPILLQLAENARSDRGALVQFLTANAGSSSHAGRIANAVGNEHLSTDTATEDGLMQVFSAIEGLGGPDSIRLVAGGDSWDKRYALNKAYAEFSESGEVDPNTYNQALALFNQAQFETKSGDRQGLATALVDQKVFKGITGASEGTFTDKQMSLLLQTISIGDLQETGSGRDTDFLVAKAKSALSRSGVYVLNDTTQGESRPFVGFTRSTAVPEAIGQTTEKIQSGLNNKGSTLDVFLSQNIESGTKSVWDIAYRKVLEGVPEGSAIREALTPEAFTSARRKENARIVVNSLQADRSTPIYLVLEQENATSRSILLGNVNFSQEDISTVISNYSDKAFADPESLKRKRTRGMDVQALDGAFFEGISPSQGQQFQGP